MNIPVKVALNNSVEKISTVMDDELHQLVLEGQVSYKDAVKALKEAGLELDKRFYPWLQYVENLVTGEFDKEPAITVSENEQPKLLSKEAEKTVLSGDSTPAPNTNPEGAD